VDEARNLTPHDVTKAERSQLAELANNLL